MNAADTTLLMPLAAAEVKVDRAQASMVYAQTLDERTRREDHEKRWGDLESLRTELDRRREEALNWRRCAQGRVLGQDDAAQDGRDGLSCSSAP